MKKAVIAIFTLTGMLLAGCSAELPIADMTDLTEQPTEVVNEQTEQPAPNDEHIFLSDSNSEIDTAESYLPSDKTEDTTHAILPVSEEPDEAEPKHEDKPQAEEAKKVQEEKPAEKAVKKSDKTPTPVANTGLEIVIPTTEPEPSEPAKTEPVPQPEKPATPTPTPTVEPTPAPTPEPTPEPQVEMETMGGGFNSDVLAAINEARALHGNAAMSLDGGLCAKALEHAKEMARQGKRFHSCGGVESVSDSSSSARTIGARSAIHASDLELNAGLTSLGVGSVKINGKQYTCVIGR